MKRCFTSHIIKEKQIKTTRYHTHLLEIVKIQNTDNLIQNTGNTDNTKCWQGCRAIEILIRCWWERKMVQPLKRQFLTKLDILLTYNPAIILFGFHTNEMKKYVHSKTCTCMLIPGLFVIVKTGKQPRGPLAGERINKLWCIQTMQYYFSITISELRSIKRHVGNLAVYF